MSVVISRAVAVGIMEATESNDFLSDITASEVAAIEYLQDKGCLRKNVPCHIPDCGQTMEVRLPSSGGSKFRCPVHKLSRNQVSVRKGSFWSKGFWSTHYLPFAAIIKLTFCWCESLTVEETCEQLGIDPLIVRRAFIQLREFCRQSLKDKGYSVGGPGCEVHVEVLDHVAECGYTKRVKFLCGYSPSDDVGFAGYVNDLSDENVCTLIQTYVAPNSILASCTLDPSSFRNILPNLAGFKKKPNTHLTSNYWARLKSRRRDKLCGIMLKYLNSHMQELMWREVIDTPDPTSTMETLLAQISEITSAYEPGPAAPEPRSKKEEIAHFPLPEDPEEAAKIFSIISSEDAAIAYLREHGCLRTPTICSVDGCERRLWRGSCGTRVYYLCRDHRKKQWGLKKDSFWENTKVGINTALKTLFDWARVTTVIDTAEHAKVTTTYVNEYFKKLRAVCSAWLEKNPYAIGGPDSDIQLEIFDPRVDGRKVIEERVVLGYSSRDERGFVTFTKDLSTEHICSLVKQHVTPGSVILSSSWTDYASVEHIEDANPAYKAGSLARSEPGLVKDYWTKVKRTFSDGSKSGAGLSIYDLDSYLKEFMWRVVNATEGPVKTMEAMLSHIREQYDVYKDESYGKRPTDTKGQEDSDSYWEQDISQPSLTPVPVPVPEEPPVEDDSKVKRGVTTSSLLKPVGRLPQYVLDDALVNAFRIIDKDEVLSNNAIMAEDMNMQELSVALKDPASAMQWCVKHR